MGRKNRRQKFEPLDFTPPLNIPNGPTVSRPRQLKPGERRRSSADLWEEHRKRAERQHNARINQGIDWSVCLVPGCGEELVTWFKRPIHENPRERDHRMELPICYQHISTLWLMMTGVETVKSADPLPHLGFANPKLIAAIAEVNELVAQRVRRHHEEDKAAKLADVTHGDIYFIRLNGLVKVGWTRDLWSRVKAYGASAELLVSYPGSRDDETNLHRQLTPARAKGREWYEDGDIIQMYIDRALAKYGMPPTFEGMWTTPKRIVAGKRAGRQR